jgi:hypothetical protein
VIKMCVCVCVSVMACDIITAIMRYVQCGNVCITHVVMCVCVCVCVCLQYCMCVVIDAKTRLQPKGNYISDRVEKLPERKTHKDTG